MFTLRGRPPPTTPHRHLSTWPDVTCSTSQFGLPMPTLQELLSSPLITHLEFHRRPLPTPTSSRASSRPWVHRLSSIIRVRRSSSPRLQSLLNPWIRRQFRGPLRTGAVTFRSTTMPGIRPRLLSRKRVITTIQVTVDGIRFRLQPRQRAFVATTMVGTRSRLRPRERVLATLQATMAGTIPRLRLRKRVFTFTSGRPSRTRTRVVVVVGVAIRTPLPHHRAFTVGGVLAARRSP